MSEFEAVFFDAGETLLAPHPSFHEIFTKVLNDRGHEVSPDEARTALEAAGPNFVEILDSMGETTWSTSQEVSRRFWGAVYQTAFAGLGIDDPSSELAGTLYEVFTKYDSYRLFPDALPALHAVKDAGLIVGLISNFEEWLEGMLTHWEVGHVFDVMVISGKEGIEKPDRRIFEIALERSGAAAEQSAYVGDHPHIDAAASKAVGMTGILIDRRGRHPDFEGIRIESLSELPSILGLKDN